MVHNNEVVANKDTTISRKVKNYFLYLSFQYIFTHAKYPAKPTQISRKTKLHTGLSSSGRISSLYIIDITTTAPIVSDTAKE